jgi:hypothetical protein
MIGAPRPLSRTEPVVMARLSMLHWFDSFHISPVFSNSVNIIYYSDVQIEIRPYVVRWHHPSVRWQLDSCTRPTYSGRLNAWRCIVGLLDWFIFIHTHAITGVIAQYLKENIAGAPLTFM